MSLPDEYFDALYASADDPWEFRTRFYERRKRSLTLAALPRRRYRSVFEPGCSLGLLTAGLAERADRVLAMDVSAASVERAAATVGTNVELRQGRIPDDWPDGSFDLVVLSEIVYYLDGGAAAAVAHAAARAAREVVAVHWRHPVDDYPLTGDDAHRILAAAASEAAMTNVSHHVEADFLLDVWSHDARSVAQREALPGSG